jgi:mercuric reductase
VNVGCIQSKRLITVGTLFYNSRHNSFQGIRYEHGKLDFRRVIREKNELVRKFRREKYRRVLHNLKSVTYYEGNGVFTAGNKVIVDNRTLEATKFIVATGARANIPRIEGIEKVPYLTNEEALSLKELPRSLCVIGGRALGLEFAQMYAQFGAKVTVLQRSSRILRDEEPVISKALTKHFRELNIKVHTNVRIKSIQSDGRSKVVTFSSDGSTSRLKAEHILFATGRTPNTDNLGLEFAGVRTDENGFIRVNSEMRTSASHIWAAGDVTGEPMLETLAAKEGSIAAENAFSGKNRKRVNLDEVPSAVFTYPEVARVGFTERKAHEHGMKCSCVTLPFDLVPKAHIMADTKGLVKLVVENETKRVVGVHIVAPHAADLIHEGVLAVKFKLTIDDIIDTVHVFPTLSESLKLAAQSFYKDVGSLSCCIE